MYVEGINEQFRGDDEAKAQELFLEQHCYADLDGDGYEEPYIVTVHKDSGKVARVIVRYDATGIKLDKNGRVVRIEPIMYFTKYSFIPAPNGKFHDLGFSQLLGPLNETINTLVNQLLDSGTLANLQGGFVGRGIKWQGGAMRFIPGEWKSVDVTGGILKDNIVPMPTREPSGVLFQLLGSLTEMSDKLASVSDAMSGEMPSQNTPATTVLAMIEQGLKVFTSIYKRVFRSLKSEYKKLYRLNGLHLAEQEYYRVLDSQSAVFKQDYNGSDLDIIPCADPTISSEAQKLARAQALFQTMQVNPSPSGRAEILKRYYEALDVPELDKVLPAKEIQQITTAPPPPDPAMLKLQADMLKQKHEYENSMQEMEMKQEKQHYELEQIKANIELTKANAIKALADAESKEAGQQFELYRHEVEQLATQVKLAIEVKDAHTRSKMASAKFSEDGESEPGDSAESGTGSP
jgi:chaperonin GroES